MAPAPLLASAATAATAIEAGQQLSIQAQLLFIGVLFLGTLAISRFSIKIGIPAILGVLLLGLAINLRDISISHEQAESFHLLGLALLLFYAGLKTDLKAIRGILEYGVLLAIGGVALSSLLIGWILWLLSSATADQISPGISDAMPLGAALLVAACLGSTDAGATVSVLRAVRPRIPERLRNLLEFESSVNDPSALLFYGLIMGIFVINNQGSSPPAIPITVLVELKNFTQQVGAGLLVGFVFGYLARFVINDLVEEESQLLVVAMSIAFVVYGTAHYMGGSGLMGIYVTGLFLTNTRYRSATINQKTLQEALLPFNTMTEISVFLVFGLLVYPPDLLASLPVGLLTAFALMLVARPISVLIFQPFSPFRLRETLLISWCGLRGAVPLALSYNLIGAIPDIRGLDPALVTDLTRNAQSIVFILVVVNLFVQGLTLPLAARWLGIEPDAAPGDPSVTP